MIIRQTSFLCAAALGCAFIFIATANAAVPDGINYQAYLSNADGSPVDADTAVTFAAFNVDMGGVPLWNQSQTVSVDQGLFSVTLGNPANPFPADLFDGPVYIGLFVAGEEMLPRRVLTSAAYAFKASDADTLNGLPATSLDQSDDVATLQGDVSTLDTTVVSNESRISDLEATGGDITSVNAGPGLTGGSSIGNATLSVATGGINVTHLAGNSVSGTAIIDGTVGRNDLAIDSVRGTNILDGTVTAFDIADGAVVPTKLDATQSYTMDGVTITDELLLTDQLVIDSTFDIHIYDNFNAIRWFGLDESTPYSALLINSTSVSNFDFNQSRYVYYSDANGVGIGTDSTAAGYAVTVPSLSVAGNTDIGHEIVSVVYSLDQSDPVCESHGNQPCFRGIGSASCPVGKKVLGGGNTSSAVGRGNIGTSRPLGLTMWECASTYSVSGITATCYAICARLD